MKLRPVHFVIAVLVIATLGLAFVYSLSAFLVASGFVAFAGLLLAIDWFGQGWDSRIRGPLRVEGVQSAGEALGLGFSKRDPANLVRSVPLILFGDFPHRGCRNFVWGTWRGRSVVAFDFWSDDIRMTALFPRPHPGVLGDDGVAETQPVHSYVAARIDADCPPVLIERRGPRTSVHPAISLREVQLESERFDRAFRVVTTDPRAATALIDPRMMGFLASMDPSKRVEVAGGWIALLGPFQEPRDLRSDLDAAVTLADQVPRVIGSLYPPRPRTLRTTPANN